MVRGVLGTAGLGSSTLSSLLTKLFQLSRFCFRLGGAGAGRFIEVGGVPGGVLYREEFSLVFRELVLREEVFRELEVAQSTDRS